ncbi:MAG: type II secretion system F family protein [Micrococcales bacterium]
MSNPFVSLLPALSALAMMAAVFVAATALIKTFKALGHKNVLAAMPKYTLRALSTPEQVAAAQEVDETSLFLRIGTKLLSTRYKNWLITKLQSAGIRGNAAISALVGQKITYAVVGGVVGALFALQNPSYALPAMAALLLVGFFVPDYLTYSKAQKRSEEIDRGLPDSIDLLNMCVEAGLSFEAAASRVSVSLDGPVPQELGALLAEIQLGKSRLEAMTSLAERTKSPGFLRFLTAMLQVDRLGVPISNVLAEQASEMRAKRKDRAREQAQKVTIKVLMPLMLCFLPAMFIVVVGPAIVQLVRGLGSMG